MDIKYASRYLRLPAGALGNEKLVLVGTDSCLPDTATAAARSPAPGTHNHARRQMPWRARCRETGTARPQTLYGIADPPVGLAAWLLDHNDAGGQPAAAVLSALDRVIGNGP